MTELEPDAYRAAVARGAHVVDVRPAAARQREPLAGALALTLTEVQAGARPALPPDAEILVVCEYGRLSRLVGLYLETEGFRSVASLRGGLLALRRSASERSADP